MNIALINGPNINLLGLREKEIYGNTSLDAIYERIDKKFCSEDVSIIRFQSNIEGEIVDFIHEHINEIDGVVLNPAGLSKCGYSLLDALNALPTPYIEVHISNVFKRGGWHAESIFFESAVGIIVGLETMVYDYGITAIIDYLNNKKNDNVK